jgi:argininosuccinate synthase
VKRIVLAFSGEADEAVAIPWLSETLRADVVTVTLDLGLGRDPTELRERALALGAVRAHVLDVRESFATEGLLPALRAGALADAGPATAVHLARPLVARHLVDIARLERATAVAHAASGSDREAMDALIRAVDPAIAIMTPADTWKLSAADKLDILRDRGVAESLADADQSQALEAPDSPATVEIAFEQGAPVEISGVPMGVAELIQCLDTIAGGHGVGRGRGQGTAALIVLDAAHRALQETGALDDNESGLVRLELFKGECRVIGRHAMA